MSNLALHLSSGDGTLSVRELDIHERVSGLFVVSLVAVSEDPSLDLDAAVGRAARFSMASGLVAGFAGPRLWEGVCTSVEQLRVEPDGLSTYAVVISPWMWRLTQRRNCRLFQHTRIPDIVETLLAEWDIVREWRVEHAAYPKLELRTQFEESDHAFICRLLEEAGISFHFEDDLAEGRSKLVLSDRPHGAEPRLPPLPFVDSPGQAQAGTIEMVTEVRVRRDLVPGKEVVSDFDFRRPGYNLIGTAGPVPDPEERFEQFRYSPDSALLETGGPEGGTPVADDLGTARSSQVFLDGRARLGLEATRASRRRVTFRTNALDLRPGVVFSMLGHPHALLSPATRLLVLDLRLRGTHDGEWQIHGQAHFAEEPYRPLRVTPKPHIQGQQSAIVVGPAGEEIYTDEYGRVRVQFHWDRVGRRDPRSSMWMRVSQGWAGPGYGMINIPRVGHEVLVAFLGGDPDCPYVAGRLFNAAAQVPHALPDNKTVSAWKSDSSPRSGGFNEIRFDDAQGREHVYVQAERDLDLCVKNNQMSAVGNDRTRLVQHDETVCIGRDRTKVVQQSQIQAVGLHDTTTVGVNRNTTVGADDTTLVGSKWSVSVARGLTAKLTGEMDALMRGPLGSVLFAPVVSVLGLIPRMPLGGGAALADLARGPLSLLAGAAPAAMRSILGVMEGFAADPGPPPTSIEMVDRKITLTTGEASIILDGPNVSILADGNILFHARKNVGALADQEGVLAAQKKVMVLSAEGDAIVQGGPMLHLNPFHERQQAGEDLAGVPEHEHDGGHEHDPEQVVSSCCQMSAEGAVGAPLFQDEVSVRALREVEQAGFRRTAATDGAIAELLAIQYGASPDRPALALHSAAEYSRVVSRFRGLAGGAAADLDEAPATRHELGELEKVVAERAHSVDRTALGLLVAHHAELAVLSNTTGALAAAVDGHALRVAAVFGVLKRGEGS